MVTEKKDIMSRWRCKGVNRVNDEMYNFYKKTTECECCLTPFKDSKDRCLDHDHDTGDFRWVICQRCNRHDTWEEVLESYKK